MGFRTTRNGRQSYYSPRTRVSLYTYRLMCYSNIGFNYIYHRLSLIMLLLLLLITRETPYGGSQNVLAPESSLCSGLLATSLLYAALFCTSPTE